MRCMVQYGYQGMIYLISSLSDGQDIDHSLIHHYNAYVHGLGRKMLSPDGSIEILGK